MVIPSGGSEGGPDNLHKGADQWLYVEAGAGEAIVNGHSYPLVAGSLMLIVRGDKHEIRNTGRSPLRTLNFYVPPAYTSEGDELPRATGS
jgi:mannose-6-phosphate isomerase-like protein (cupin superfamily)